MTKEGAEIIRGAMKVITEQCRAAFSCENCPLYDCCQGTDDLFERSPDRWFQKVVPLVSEGGLDDNQ